MASTFSSSLNLELMATGENVGTWGTRANDRVFQLLDEAVAGYVAVSVSAVVSLDIAQASSSPGRNRWIEIVGNYPVSGAFNVRIPAVEKDYWLKVSVSTSGVLSMNVAVSGQGGSTVTAVSATNRVQVLPWRRFLCDGTSVYDVGSPLIPDGRIALDPLGIVTIVSGIVTSISAVSAETSISQSGTKWQVGLAGSGTLRFPTAPYQQVVSVSLSSGGENILNLQSGGAFVLRHGALATVSISITDGSNNPTFGNQIGKSFLVYFNTFSETGNVVVAFPVSTRVFKAVGVSGNGSTSVSTAYTFGSESLTVLRFTAIPVSTGSGAFAAGSRCAWLMENIVGYAADN